MFQELEPIVNCPGTEGVNILSSITSTCIKKVSLVYRCVLWRPSWRDINWDIFDEPLYRLVDQLERTHKLKMDFRFVDKGIIEGAGDNELVMTVNCLARFREKDQITVVWVDQDGSENTACGILDDEVFFPRSR